MYDPEFDPTQWVYVNDPLGRLGQGHYKNKTNPGLTLSADDFEGKRKKRQSPKKNKEQNINIKPTPVQSALSPWDNPQIGEQKAHTTSQAHPEPTPSPAPVEAAAKPPAQTGQNQKSNTQKEEEEEEYIRQGRESDGGDNGSVICTEMVRQKKMSESDARASTFYAHTRLPASFMRGYRFWAVPYVRLMRIFPPATTLISPIVHHRTTEILYRLNKRAKGSFFGKCICLIHDTFCMGLGQIVGDTNYKPLYEKEKVAPRDKIL